MFENLALVVPKRRKKTFGGVRGASEKFDLVADIEKQTSADIQGMLVEIGEREIREQRALDNPISRSVIDRSNSKKLVDIERKGELLFGSTINRFIMFEIEQVLSKQLAKVNLLRMSRLQVQNDESSWETVLRPRVNIEGWGWFYYRNKKSRGVPVTRSTVGQLPRDSYLVFRPASEKAAEIASWANHNYLKLRVGETVSKRGRRSGGGFIAQTTRALSRKGTMKAFSFWGGYTRSHQANGETWKHGTPFIAVRPLAKRTGKR